MIEIPVHLMVQLIELAMICLTVLCATIVMATRRTAGLRDVAALVDSILRALGALLRGRTA